MKRAINMRLTTIVILLVLSSCTQQKGGKDYIAFIEEPSNGYHRSIEVGDLIYDIQYKPSRYIASKDANADKNNAGINERIKNLKGTVWFNVKINVKASEVNPLKHNVGGLSEYNTRLTYFLNEAAGDFNMVYNGINIGSPYSYFFENNYTLTPYDLMIVGFKIPDDVPKEDLTLIYDDKAFNNGLIKVKITKQEFSALEQIN